MAGRSPATHVFPYFTRSPIEAPIRRFYHPAGGLNPIQTSSISAAAAMVVRSP